MAYLCTMNYEHLFFDLDHTLWDFEANAKDTLSEIFQQTDLQNRGIANFDTFFERYSIHNKHLWDLYTQGRIKQDILRWKRMYLAMLDFKIADEPLAHKMDKAFLEILPTKSKLFPHTREVLDYLANKNYHLSLVTNGFDIVQHGKLKSSRLEHFFEQVITSERSNSLKPQREIFEFALKASGAQKESSIMIGDNPDADIKGAREDGIDTIWANYTHEPTDVKATYTITNLEDLYRIL